MTDEKAKGLRRIYDTAEGLRSESRPAIDTNEITAAIFKSLKPSKQAAVVANRHRQLLSQGKRTDIFRQQNDSNDSAEIKRYSSSEIVGKQYGISKNTVGRLVRINMLCDELKDLLDKNLLSIRAGVNLSYLTLEIQQIVADMSTLFNVKIDIEKSTEIRAICRNYSGSRLKEEVMEIMIREKPRVKQMVVHISEDTFLKYFDKSAKAEEISETIEKALDMYFEGLDFKPTTERSVGGYLEIDPEEWAECTDDEGRPF